MSIVEKGKVIEIDYTARTDDGEVADTTEGEPLPYLHGSNDMIDGLQAVLEGKTVGDTLTVTLTPEQAFGEYDEDLVDEIPKSSLPEDADVAIGDEIMATAEDGSEYPAFVADIRDDVIAIDLNHPLAGETLTYEVKVISIRDATAEELARNSVESECDHDCGCECHKFDN